MSSGIFRLAEARGLLGQLHGGRDLIFIGLGRQNLGVVSDEGGLHPIGALILDGKLQQFGLCAIEEGSGFSQRRRFGSRRPGKSRTQDKELQQGFASGWVGSPPSADEPMLVSLIVYLPEWRPEQGMIDGV